MDEGVFEGLEESRSAVELFKGREERFSPFTVP
jgi:hypothetical protein